MPMRRRTLLMLWLLVMVAWVAAMAWLVGSTDLGPFGGGKHGGAGHLQAAARSVREGLAHAPAAAWRAARPPLLLALLGALALLPLRAIARNRRRQVRLELLPYRTEQTDTEDVRRMLESWHQQLLERWWRRLFGGQRGIALEVVTRRNPDGVLVGRLSIVCPRELERAVTGTLRACYPNSRLNRGEALSAPRRVVRLKKRHVFVQALRELEEQRRNVVDATLQQMTALGRPSVVQVSLTPTPAFFDRFSRSRFRHRERRYESARNFDPNDPGLRSETVRQELVGGLRVQHRPLFFADIRVAAETNAEASAIAGTIRGESAGENRLLLRKMLGRGELYRHRIALGIGNPVPNWRHGVLSSTEAATLWHVPSPALKGAVLTRSPVPSLPAPPEVSRVQSHALMHDESGRVGILPEDKTDGLGLIGGQKTGKTSVLCRSVQADAVDPDCAVIVLMPKPGDALKALSMVPPGRTVHYLDLEQPEFGINPLLATGDPAMVADKVVEAFRDVNVEGDIRGSSDRYLRQAAQAAIGASRSGVLQGPPTLWDMYRMLLPAENTFREQVVAALLPEPGFTDTVTFFGRELPADLRDAASQTTAKLDAPRNKLLRLMVQSLDKVLRHPHQLSLDEMVRGRETLIVDGKMGTFGSDNCRVMMQFILNSLYGTLQRQQQLPEEQRVRVALKVDEAHLVLNDSFADALATLRSAGLEVVAAWQYGEQIQDPKIRAGMLSLLRQRCMFSMGEAQDAREMSSIAMAVYADMIHADPAEQEVLRVTPDTIFNLPNHHAVCSWISHGTRVPAFLAQTFPLEQNEEVVRHHREAQQARGGFVPDRLPDPLPELEPGRGHLELPSDRIALAPREPEERGASEPPRPGNGQGASSDRPKEPGPAPGPDAKEPGPAPGPDAVEGEELIFDPAASSLERPNERAAQRQAGPPPESYTELDLDKVRGVIWDKVTPLPADRRGEPTARELEILAALWSHRFLFAGQIHRRWWRGSSLRATQQALGKMTKSGLLRRFKFQLAEPGAQQRVYCLTREGFELAQQRSGRRGPYISAEASWREPQISDPRRVLRDLHSNGWVLALERVCGRSMSAWRGPRESRLDPPRRRVRGEWREIRPPELTVGERKLHDYEPSRFEPVSPEATVELRLPVGNPPLRLDLLVELERFSNPAAAEERLRRYDGLISGWASLLDRYRTLGTPPLVVFVCEDERVQEKLVRLADRVLTARLAKAGTEEAEWPCPARKAIFFSLERDVHEGSLRALQVSEHPPEVRMRLGGPGEKACRPWHVHIVEPRMLGQD
jgi:hypothetical protein